MRHLRPGSSNRWPPPARHGHSRWPMSLGAPPGASLSSRWWPRQRRSAFTVGALVEAAVRALLVEGHDRLTTRRVAEVAGVSVGSVYQNFPNRGAPVAEPIRHRVAASVAALAAAADGPEGEALGTAAARVLQAFAAAKAEAAPVTRAVRPAFAELRGRRAVADGARAAEAVFLRLAARGQGGTLTADEASRVVLAVAATEGAIALLIERQPERLGDPGLGRAPARVFLAAWASG